MVIFAVLQNFLFISCQSTCKCTQIWYFYKYWFLFFFPNWFITADNNLRSSFNYIGMDAWIDKKLHLWLNLFLLFLKIRSNKLNNEVKKRGGGFNKLCSLSPQLREFLGVPELARTEVYPEGYGEYSFSLLSFNLITLNYHNCNDMFIIFLRLSSKHGPTLEKKICKTQVIDKIWFVMNSCMPFLV